MILHKICIYLCQKNSMAQDKHYEFGEHFEKFIAEEVSSGRYKSANDVVQSALMLLETQEASEKKLVSALIEGEESGFRENFDFKAHLSKLNKLVL